MKGKLYGVGVGPGDPELLTLKAVHTLQKADIIALPDKGGGEQTALAIAGRWVEGKPRLSCPMPMVHSRERMEAAHQAAADQICALLDEGKQVAFLTLGDPTVYSTYSYLHQKILERGYPAELIPGVPSFCAAAAKLNTSLCQGTERLLIVPACHGVEDTFELPANKVYMKAGGRLDTLKMGLAAHGQLEHALAAANVGMEGEQLWTDLTKMEERPGYFAVVVVKQT